MRGPPVCLRDLPAEERSAVEALARSRRPRRGGWRAPAAAGAPAGARHRPASRWKVLRSRALAGRRFETWEEVAEAVAQATERWNAHRQPVTGGQRRRHRPHRQPGIALLPKAA
ncbi:hypothetical protein [Benzoatithermus flavus]|uniref:Transposase n=1 Tax=Benzoatithermus flavus TaxID=3108223 RepID=A0ABU8XWZ5_9PROT